MSGISIFRTADGFFLDCNADDIASVLVGKAAQACSGTFDIPENMAKRIANVGVEAVDDGEIYILEPVEKVKVNRKPENAPGSMVVQALIFSKKRFASVGECKSWIKGSKFGDFGVDETENSFRFRQYDPEHFSDFRTTTLTDGVSAVVGRVVGGAKTSSDEKDSAEDTDTSKREKTGDEERPVAPDDVKAVNERIREHGLLVLKGSEQENKPEGAEEKEERYVLSLVMEPNDGQSGAPFKPDTQGDIQSAQEIRKTAHRWMEHYGLIDLVHSWQSLTKDDVRVLESYLAPADFRLGDGDSAYTVGRGSWLLAVRVINDAIWKAIKGGELGAYSIGGTAERVPVGAPQESEG